MEVNNDKTKIRLKAMVIAVKQLPFIGRNW